MYNPSSGKLKKYRNSYFFPSLCLSCCAEWRANQAKYVFLVTKCPLLFCTIADSGASGESGSLGINFKTLKSFNSLNRTAASEDNCFTEW